MPVIDGLVSGIDTTSIVNELLKIRQQRIDVLTAQQKEVGTRQSAFKQIEAGIISLRAQGSRLARSQNNVFDARGVVSSDEDALSATAASRAVTGVFQIRVNTLAQAHQIAAQGFADADSQITTGTFTVRGGGEAATITIDSTNNTLQGLADSINAAGVGVSASIVQDASNPAEPFRLLLTSNNTGTKNAITITNNLAASSGGAVRPDFNLATPVQAATDASVQLGTGAGAIVATSDTNTVTGLISGVTLNLKEADPARTLTLTISQDTESSVASVQDFVDAYNQLMEQFDQQFKFVAETNQAGVLLGNRTATELQLAVRQSVLGVVPGVNSKVNRLSAIGISVTDKGHLTFNQTKLEDALNGRVAGVTADDVRRLFALDGQSTSGGVQYVLGSTRTGAPDSPVQVDVTQAAERGSITAGSALAASTVIDATNDTVSVRLDGASDTAIKLTHGTYTQTDLAAELERAINGSSSFSGRQASVGQAAGVLTIQSDSYGSTSEIAVTGGNALATLRFAGTEADFGLNVAGSFIVDGQTEVATGRGRLLVGDPDNKNTADLQVRVTLSAAQLQAGADAEITMTRGLGSKMDQVLGKLLDSETGRIKFANDGFDEQIETLQKAIDRQNAFFEKQQQQLIDQFTALESVLSQLQTQASYISSQLTSINQSKSA